MNTSSSSPRPAARTSGLYSRTGTVTLGVLVGILLLAIAGGAVIKIGPSAPNAPKVLSWLHLQRSKDNSTDLAGMRLVARSYYDARVASLRCACDRRIGVFAAGPQLARDLRTVRLLQRDHRHWAITVTPPAVGKVAMETLDRGGVALWENESRQLYQGLVPIRRMWGPYRVSYQLIRTPGGWKVSRTRLLSNGRHTVPLFTAPATGASAAYIVDDTTLHVLYAYRADVPRYVASTAKMVTALIALRRLGSDAIVTVPYEAGVVGGTSANLYVGERMRVRDLLYGMLLPSGNDAAVTLADAAAGSMASFAGLMNDEAVRLRLRHSHFVVPHGLDFQGQYSSARDLARVAHALLRVPLLAAIVKTRYHHATSVDHVYSRNWTNLNHLLGSYPGAVGVKTGTTPAAGANLVAATNRGSERIIAVLLGDTTTRRFSDAGSLLDYGWRLMGYGSAGSAGARLPAYRRAPSALALGF